MAITIGSIYRLPRGCTALFVGEGAANIVFEIALSQDLIDIKGEGRSKGARRHHTWSGYLLRVPKKGKCTYNYEELQKYWENEISKRFRKDDLVEQTLVDLSESGIIPHLNEVLAAEDDQPETFRRRRPDFVGGRVDDVKYGMLVEDMRKQHPSDLLIEFKPKWLTQSPSAPKNSKRCRTCAREALRQHKDQKGGMRRMFCPLDLLECNRDSRAFGFLCSGLVPPELPRDSVQFRLFTQWLKNNTLLRELARLQDTSDRYGMLNVDHSGHSLELAMALRDCSCFVRIPGGPATNGPGTAHTNGSAEKRRIVAKLGDVDKKNQNWKLAYWQDLEKQLCQGYYQGTEPPKSRTNCRLERSS